MSILLLYVLLVWVLLGVMTLVLLNAAKSLVRSSQRPNMGAVCAPEPVEVSAFGSLGIPPRSAAETSRRAPVAKVI